MHIILFITWNSDTRACGTAVALPNREQSMAGERATSNRDHEFLLHQCSFESQPGYPPIILFIPKYTLWCLEIFGDAHSMYGIMLGMRVARRVSARVDAMSRALCHGEANAAAFVRTSPKALQCSAQVRTHFPSKFNRFRSELQTFWLTQDAQVLAPS